jgi:hypothetical protein
MGTGIGTDSVIGTGVIGMRADITTIAAANFLRPCLIEGVRRRSSHGLYSVFFKQTAVAGHNRSISSGRIPRGLLRGGLISIESRRLCQMSDSLAIRLMHRL